MTRDVHRPTHGARKPLPASAGLRLTSLLIDICVLTAIVVVGTLSFADPADPLPTATWLIVGTWLASFLVEGSTGRTVGKLVTGLRVVDSSGNKPSFQELIARRTYGNRVLIGAYSLLRGRRSRHDRMSGTYVVRAAQPWQGEP